MKLLALVLVGVLLGSAYSASIPTWAFDTFVHWMQKNGKSYSSPSEKQYRAGIFYQNLLHIQAVNSKQNDYTLGANKFADLTVDEFLELNTGYNTQIEKLAGTPQVIDVEEALPEEVDWVTAGAVTPVKNQEQCGDCWAFSTVGALEGLYEISTGNLVSMSEQQLTDCSYGYGNMGCDGGLMDNAFKYVMAKGIETEAAYPFVGKFEKCQYNAADVVYTITGYTDVTPYSNLALQTASAQQPVSIAIDAENIMLYTGGIFNDPDCGTQLDHGVTLVGYGVDAGTPYWLVKNSWGTDWGEAGYIRFIRSTVDNETAMCCLNCDPSYPTWTH